MFFTDPVNPVKGLRRRVKIGLVCFCPADKWHIPSDSEEQGLSDNDCTSYEEPKRMQTRQCRKCGKKNKTIAQRDVHELTCTGAHDAQCPWCFKEFDSVCEKRRHMITKQCDIEKITCEGTNITVIRKSTGYVNASAMAQRAKKILRAYLDSSETQDFIFNIGRSEAPGMVVVDDADANNIWVHPQLAYGCAIWCKSTFVEPVRNAVTQYTGELLHQVHQLEWKDGTAIAEIRMTDGYVNSSLMIQHAGKMWSSFFRSTMASTIIMDLKRAAGNTAAEIVRQRGRKEMWIHPTLAIELARWCSKENCLYMLTRVKAFVGKYRTDNLAAARPMGPIEIRDDGFVNAKKLCRVSQRPWGHFIRMTSTKAMIDRLGRAGVMDVVQIDKDGIEGIWVHPSLAVNLATYCGKEYEVHLMYAQSGVQCVLFEVNVEPSSSRLPDADVEQGPYVATIAPDDEPLFDASLIRASDGYVNATKLCHNEGKQWSTFNQWKAKTVLKELSAELGIPAGDLVECKKGGAHDGTWVHPDVAIKLLGWCRETPKVPVVKATEKVEEYADPITSAETPDAMMPTMEECSSAIVPTFPSASSFVESLFGDDGQMITQIRVSDGYVNATKMCQSAGKLWAHFSSLSGTKKFLEELSSNIGIAIEDLVISACGGDHSGTWVHPDVAIELAGWCSVKFKVQVGQLVKRYMRGELTTEESKEVSQKVRKAFEPPKQIVPANLSGADFTDGDIIPSPPDERYRVLPDASFAPNGVYILSLGLNIEGTHEIGMWGLGASLPHRLNTHFKTYKFSKVTAIVTCGLSNPARLETALSNFFAPWHLPILRTDGTVNTECFGIAVGEARKKYDEAIEMIKASFDEVDSITLYGKTVMDNTKRAKATTAPWISDSLEVEKEKTKQKELELQMMPDALRLKELELEVLNKQLELARLTSTR